MNIQQYLEANGLKRFKRTKEEVELGLSPEEALNRRLGKKNVAAETPIAKKQKLYSCHIALKPEPGIDSDFMEFWKENLEVCIDRKWIGWYDTLNGHPYYGDAQRLLEDILSWGMDAAIQYKYSTYYENDDNS